jgi:hypothetical protein
LLDAGPIPIGRAMRANRSLLHLLLALAVLLCGLHIGEPSHAEDGAGAHAVSHAVGDAEHSDDEAPGQDEATSHHHCPMAPAVAAPDGPAAFATIAIHGFRPDTALGSLTRAPPLEPPAS